ncbi:MAG: MBL fold metallo-hydrolase [Thermodesulfovibrionales bacterium]
MMKIETVVVGPLQVNCYIMYDEETLQAVVVDPGDDLRKILDLLRGKKLDLKTIICTHGHFDHIGAVSGLKAETGAEIVLSQEDLSIYQGGHELAFFMGYPFVQPPDPDRFVREGDVLTLGNISFRLMQTPGHSPGSICLLSGSTALTGDTVFAGSIGRTDFPGGSLAAMKKSFARVIGLPPETLLLPGHGPATTVQDERETNFFMHEL